MNLSTEWNAFSSVKAIRLKKQYEEKFVLRQVDLTLESSNCALLMGKNGTGKSSLLRILSLQESALGGELLFNEIPLKNWKPSSLQKQIGFAGHFPGFHGELSPLENLQYFGRFYLSNVHLVEKRAHELLSHFKISHREQTSQLSYGTLQKLSLCRAFFHKPSLLLLDEPYQGLDTDGIMQLNELIQYAQSQGAIILLVTHTPSLAQTLPNHVYMLQQGIIQSVL